MIDNLLALIPQYGVALIFSVVALSCLAVPLPSSALVLGSGAFAAVGDLVAWQVAVAAFAGFTLGDQLAYRIGRKKGAALLTQMRKRRSTEPLITRAERMIARSGMLAVFLSRTVLSPLGPYMSYLSGATRLQWRLYTMASVPGAALWSSGYTAMGYGVVDQLEPSAALLWNLAGLVSALAVVWACVWWLRRAVRHRALA